MNQIEMGLFKYEEIFYVHVPTGTINAPVG